MVGMTGASGAIYATRFLKQAALKFKTVYVMVSDQALQVVQTELGIPITRGTLTSHALLGQDFGNIVFLDQRDYFSPPASGSFRHDGMVIVPCSMGTAGRIAHGTSDDLLTRSADVCLKERRKLIVVVREMPWSTIHLRNLTTLSEAGATVLPACPAWYTRPSTLEELADTVVARILQQLDVDQDLMPQWQYTEPE